MEVEIFVLPLTVDGKKVKAAGTKFKPIKETLYRVSVPMVKWEKVFVFTLKDEATRIFHYYKTNDTKHDMLAKEIMNKLIKSRV
jgi:hypothetical protein